MRSVRPFRGQVSRSRSAWSSSHSAAPPGGSSLKRRDFRSAAPDGSGLAASSSSTSGPAGLCPTLRLVPAAIQRRARRMALAAGTRPRSRTARKGPRSRASNERAEDRYGGRPERARVSAKKVPAEPRRLPDLSPCPASRARRRAHGASREMTVRCAASSGFSLLRLPRRWLLAPPLIFSSVVWTHAGVVVAIAAAAASLCLACQGGPTERPIACRKALMSLQPRTVAAA
jgi:hypothetical protein